MILAIFQNERIYEGNINFLNAVCPMPAVSKVVVDSPSPSEAYDFGAVNSFAPPVFREDTFDPVTRVRRGRFYIADNPNRRDWTWGRINHFPYGQPVGAVVPSLNFDSYCTFQPTQADWRKRPLVFLGTGAYRTAWRIVGMERLVNDETMATLKAADTLGLLPELNYGVLPPEKSRNVLSALDKTADAASMYLPVPVADVCREAARVLLAAWLPVVGVARPAGDLGRLVQQIPERYGGIRAAAQIIGRFHSRGKSSERERQAAQAVELREVEAADADLSVALIAMLVRDMGWASKS